MKKFKYISIALIGFAAIITILLYNKSKIAAKSKSEVKDVYYVSVDNAAFRKISEDISFMGTVSANNDVNIISETQGKITGVFAKVGDYKTAGSILFQVDDELKKAALMTAEANYQKAKKDFERYNELYKEKSATDAQLDGAKLTHISSEAQYIIAKRQLSDTKITTPISGVVTARYVDVGAMVQGAPQATLVANVIDISKLKVKLNVTEKDAFKLKTGDPVEVTTDVYKGEIFHGKIETISSKGDDAHTFPVEISISNDSKNSLKAGMFARVSFNNLSRNKLLVIPRESLVGSIKEPQVFVVEDEIVKLRNLVLGSQFGTFVEVLNGIKEGETLVTNGQNNLVNNVKVEILK